MPKIGSPQVELPRALVPIMDESERIHERSLRVVASIDLHGYRKADAISRLTEFLDQTNRKHKKVGPCWVEVITGSGAHSLDGPVIRPAVHTLLEQRQLTWKAKGKGNACFLVDAASGIALFEPDQPQDSKVIVSNSITNPELTQGRRSSTRSLVRGNGTELQRDMEAEVIRQSTKALKKAFIQRRNEAKALERAINVSLNEATKEKELEEQEFEKAVSLSIVDNSNEMDEEANLRRIIELSKEETNAEQSAENSFLRALELSRKYHELCSEIDEMTEEEMLQAAIAMSEMEFQLEKLTCATTLL